MTDKERLKLICKELDLPKGQWLVQGSGIMVMHGLRDHKPMGDVDIFCATRLWFDLYHEGLVGIIREGESAPWKVWTTNPDDPARRADPPYLYKEMHGIEVNIFFNWRRRGVGDLDVNFLLANTEDIEGVPCSPLQFVLDWKRAVGRAKDRDDIAVLERHLGA